RANSRYNSKPKCGFFFFSSRRRHTRLQGDWSSDVCSSDLLAETVVVVPVLAEVASPSTLAMVSAPVLRKLTAPLVLLKARFVTRSEERRVGKECRWRWWQFV